jgi:hypothetical protein
VGAPSNGTDFDTQARLEQVLLTSNVSQYVEGMAWMTRKLDDAVPGFSAIVRATARAAAECDHGK